MDNLAYRDEMRYEYIHGVPVAMSPRPATNHNIVAGNIYYLFRTFLHGKKCMAFSDGMDVHLDDDNCVIPDAMIVCNPNIIKEDGVYGAPDLIVEILSPSTAKRDKSEKKDLYEKHGIKEYWIVDTANRSIEVYLLKDGQYKLDNVYSIYPDYLLKNMTDEEKSAIVMEFHPAEFAEMTVSLNDVFDALV